MLSREGSDGVGRLPATKQAAGEHGGIQLCESKGNGSPHWEGISLQTHSIIRSILAGISSSGYTDEGQIPSKHKVGGSNPSRGATLMSHDIVDSVSRDRRPTERGRDLVVAGGVEGQLPQD